VRFSRNAGRRAAAATLAGAAILGTASACSSSGSPASSSTSATAGSTASASAKGGGALDGLSADEIASRATADLKAVSSVHVNGSVQSSGQNIALNLSLGSQGCTGTMGIDGQGSFVLLKIGKSLWIKPDDKFWKHAAGSDGSALVDLVSGPCVTRPSSPSRSAAT
jgi:hypothetical protein